MQLTMPARRGSSVLGALLPNGPVAPSPVLSRPFPTGRGAALGDVLDALPPPPQDPSKPIMLPPRLDATPPALEAANPGGPPSTSPVTQSPADARPDYVAMLTQALGPRPELHGLRKAASIIGPALMAATGNQAGANAMIQQLAEPGRDWDERNRQAQLAAVQWRREDARDAAKRAEPQYFSGNEDRVRYDPTTRSASVVYDAPQDFEDYAHAQGLEPGTPGYFSAVEDYVLRGNGPTAFKYDRDLAMVRSVIQQQQQAARQRDAVALENLRQGGRLALRQTPVARAAGSGGNNSGGGGRLPVVNTPAEAARLPSGTKFRTPDGRVKIAP